MSIADNKWSELKKKKKKKKKEEKKSTLKAKLKLLDKKISEEEKTF